MILKHKYRKEDSSSPPAPVTVSQKVTFIGVTWNLQCQTVRISDKTFSKIPEKIPPSMTASEAEGLCGRLIWASAVSQRVLAPYYFAMKIFKRITHRLNTGSLKSTDIVQIKPLDVVQKWRDDIAQHREIKFALPKEGEEITADMFSDSTLENWGAILVLPDGRVFVSGGKFDDGEQFYIFF